ncbi:MAG: outer membrane beta-barrel protein [Bacteroidota bacterium]
MKTISLATLLSLCFFSSLFAQNPYSVKGVVADTANNSKLHYATISILNAKDSTLVKFTRAAQNGNFEINSLRKGDFILLLTYPEYADFVSKFTLDSSKTSFDFKQINMKSKARLLNEVIIKGRAAAIKINGDTTEFNAGSYTIQPNDKVEDLLKKFPGLKVDNDGKITAQGKTVSKVLVDGEEFFGDDPTLVTKNLRADMVDKVQLFEKSSDQAAFTGVDDGQKTTTLNIKLKEDSKNGYFGKVDIGGATDDFYSAQLLFNKFRGKEKISVYGTTSNTGKTGLSWEDSDKYGGGTANIEFMEGGGGTRDEIDSWGGRYNGEGIPLAYNGGAHYETKWNKDKESINTNYKIGSLKVDINKNILSQQNIPDNIVNRNNDQLTKNYIFRQKLDATYQIKLDSTSNLKIMADGTLKNNETQSEFSTIGTRGDNSLLNTELRTNNNEGNEQIFTLSGLYTKRLKKLGRNYSINIIGNINEKNSEGFLYSLNEAFNTDGSIRESILTDQFKTNTIKSSLFGTNATFTEPLSKKLSVVFNYGFSLNNSKADRKSFNTSSPGNYNVLDNEFSNNFKTDQLSNQGGAILSFKGTNTVLNGGLKVNHIGFDQFDQYNNIRYKRSFVNWMPQARYQYKFTQYKSFSVSYNGRTTQPNVTQLQPVKVNDDLLNIPIGNPNLKPSYNNNFNINFNSYKVISDQSIYAYASVNFINNQIVNNTNFDNNTGKSEFQFINLDGKTPYNYYMFIDFGRKIKKLDINIGFEINTDGNTSYNFVNGVLNKTESSSYGFMAGLYKYKEKKFSFNLRFGPSYRTQQSSLNQQINSNGLATNGYGSVRIFLPAKFQISADANYTYNAGTASFDESFEQTIINTSIIKTFFKGDNLKFTLSGNDILNQNRGFSRFAGGNTITQTTFNNIKRYFMFSVAWDFNKMGPSKK